MQKGRWPLQVVAKNKYFLLSAPLSISKFQVKPLEVPKEDFQDGLLGQLSQTPQAGRL